MDDVDDLAFTNKTYSSGFESESCPICVMDKTHGREQALVKKSNKGNMQHDRWDKYD